MKVIVCGGNLTCGPREGTRLAKDCWESIVCTGTALKLPPQK